MFVKKFLWLVIFHSFVSFPAPPALHAAPYTDFFFSAAGEVWTTPEFGGQGIVIAGLKVNGLPAGSSLRLMLNTETLQIDYGNMRFGMFEMGFRLKGELFFAGLLPNYFLGGIKIPEYGFNASYIEGETHGVLSFSDTFNLALSLSGKQWFFSGNDNTGPGFFLPENRFVFTPQLILTYWAIEGDPSIAQPHYYFYRIKGLGWSVRAGSHINSNSAPWGPTDDSGDFLTSRNIPGQAAFFIHEWVRAGVAVGPNNRLQFTQHGGYGYREDDLTRARIGGMNPYVVPVHGLPWAAVLSETYVAGEISWHVRIFGDSEIVFLLDGAGVSDIERRGNGDWGFVLGSAAGLDFRFGKWFLNARFGYSFVPVMWENKHFTGFFIGFGRGY